MQVYSDEMIAKTKEIVEFAKSLGADTKIVGSWVWAFWEVKPSEEIIEKLKKEQFRWSPKNRVWQWRGDVIYG